MNKDWGFTNNARRKNQMEKMTNDETEECDNLKDEKEQDEEELVTQTAADYAIEVCKIGSKKHKGICNGSTL